MGGAQTDSPIPIFWHRMDYGTASMRSIISSSRSSQFRADGRIRYMTPQGKKRCRVCRESWKTMCFVLLIVLLAGVVAPIHVDSRGDSEAQFNIADVKIGSLNAKVLHNTKTGEYAEVVQDYSGRVEDLVLKSRFTSKVWPVLLTHNGNATAIEENAWWKGMLLLPWANRIAYGNYAFFNGSYHLKCNENSTNPTRVNALHGLLAGKKMTVEKQVVTDDYAELRLSYHFNGLEQGYPFLLNVLIVYRLSDSGFSITVEVTNPSLHGPLPFYVGWHPYFKCTAYSSYVTLDDCTKWNHIDLNSNMDPTGITELYKGLDGTSPIGGNETNPTFYDDEFKPQNGTAEACSFLQTKIHDAETNHTVVLWQDSNFRFVHVFTGSMSLFNEDAIAIEPMSAMADGYNNHDHLTVLSGGETWTGSFGVYIE